MGWTPIERHIEGFRDRLAADPAGIREEIQTLLRQEPSLRPSDRMRLLGLVVAAGKKLDEFDAADEAALAGLAIGSTSAVANADFLLQLGILRMVERRPGEALTAVNRARDLMTAELAKRKPSTKEGRRRRRWIQATKAAAYVVRGEIYLHLSVGSADRAFADALEALRLTANLVRASSHTRRVHLSAVTLLCALLARFGSPEMVDEALRVVDHAEETLIYRCRTSPDHVHRIKLKWCRALAIARKGSLARAERMLLEVIDRLMAKGLRDDAERAVDALVWVVEQTRTPGRAGYFVLKYGVLDS